MIRIVTGCSVCLVLQEDHSLQMSATIVQSPVDAGGAAPITMRFSEHQIKEQPLFVLCIRQEP